MTAVNDSPFKREATETAASGALEAMPAEVPSALLVPALPVTKPGANASAVGSTPSGPSSWQAVERILEWASERLNPILVKESRQALKSRQFLLTFALLLGFSWGWSLLGTSLMPAIRFSTGGGIMLVGYFLILAVPLILVVPFSAYRSLAAEREDGTFELISISALNARQIVTGKLGSAILQMLVYYSALSPAIAFTYMLRGVDVPTIVSVLGYTFLISVALSAVGLLVATASRSRQWQIFWSVLLLAFLAVAGFVWATTAINGLIFEMANIPYERTEFWMANLCGLSLYAATIALIILAAAGQITFASENRSTPLRVVMLVQQVLFVGWMAYFWLLTRQWPFFYVIASIAGIYWTVMGAMLIGESADLSSRSLRGLPRSFLGRLLLTWFNPGSGTGYLFAVTNLATVMMVAMLMMSITESALGFTINADDWQYLPPLILSYVTIYLGVPRICHVVLRRYFYAGIATSVLLVAMFAAAGAAMPYFIPFWLSDSQLPEFGPLQASNWVWTLAIMESVDIGQEPLLLGIVFTTAICVFAINLLVAAQEVEKVRAETPRRVEDDDRDRKKWVATGPRELKQ